MTIGRINNRKLQFLELLFISNLQRTKINIYGITGQKPWKVNFVNSQGVKRTGD